MCGIVGYVGSKSVVDILLNGLSKLEYRGYDSAGVAINSEGKIKIYKAEGKLQNLKDKNFITEEEFEKRKQHLLDEEL